LDFGEVWGYRVESQWYEGLEPESIVYCVRDVESVRLTNVRSSRAAVDGELEGQAGNIEIHKRTSRVVDRTLRAKRIIPISLEFQYFLTDPFQQPFDVIARLMTKFA
jgi:hypothetical protein